LALSGGESSSRPGLFARVEEHLAPTEYEAEWASEPVWMPRRRKKIILSLPMQGIESRNLQITTWLWMTR